MAIDVPPVVALSEARPVTTAPESVDFEQRWAAWQARGAARDHAFRRKLAIRLPVLIVVAVLIMYALLGR